MNSVLSNMTLKARIFGTSLLLLALLTGSSIYAILSMNSIGSELVSIAEHDIPLTENISRVTQHQLEQALHQEKAIRHAELANLKNDFKERELFQEEVKLFNKLEQKVGSEFQEALQLADKALKNASSEAQIKEFKHMVSELGRINEIYQNFTKHAHEAFDYIDSGELERAEQVFHQVEEEAKALDTGLVAISKEITQFTADAALEAENHEQAAVRIMLVLAAVSIFIGLTLSILMVRAVQKQLGADPAQIKKITDAISAGELNTEVGVTRENAIGVLSSLLQMRHNLRESIERDRKLAAESSRIKQALDNSSTNVMVADIDNNIIYVNPALVSMFSGIENDIRRDLPDFNINNIIGQNIDQFHKNPSHQINLVKNLSSTHNAEFVVGGRNMAFTANPIIGDDNERLGTVVEWLDRTVEIAIQSDVEQLIAAAQSGDLSRRMDDSDKTGFFKTLSQGMNQLLDTTATVFSDIDIVMGAMANGDLKLKMTGDHSGTFKDVQSNVNSTIESLREIVTSILNSTDLITSGSSEISTGNSSLSTRTEQQAASLEETASAMEELTSTVRQNADNAQQANQLADNARATAQNGGEVVANAVKAMEEINHASTKISEIIGVIDDIAFQTNLLALNASVEAARAGDQGRGFAVVATEVRNLAQRSATAAKEIKELIQDSVKKVGAGAELVSESGTALEEIVTSVVKVGDIVAEIATASQEQAVGIDQINKTVTNLDDLTQQNAALAEETSAASVSMDQHAREMVSLVGFFKLDEQVRKPVALAPAPKPASPAPAPAARSEPAKPSPKVAPAPAPAPISSNEEDDWEEF